MAIAPINFGTPVGPTPEQLAQQQQIAQAMQQQAASPIQFAPGGGTGSFTQVLAKALQGYLGGQKAQAVQQQQQAQSQQQQQQAQQLVQAYQQAQNGTPSDNMQGPSQDTGDPISSAAQPPNPQAAQALLAQAMTSNNPGLRQWGAITANNTPHAQTVSETVKAMGGADNFDPDSLSQAIATGDPSVLKARTPKQGGWQKAPDGRDVWVGANGTMQSLPDNDHSLANFKVVTDPGSGAHILVDENGAKLIPKAGEVASPGDPTSGPGTQYDPTTGLPYTKDNKGNVHWVPQGPQQQQKADGAQAVLDQIDAAGNLVADLPTPSGLAGKVSYGAERIGDLLGDNDTGMTQLTNHINMIRDTIGNSITGGNRTWALNPTAKAQVDQLIPQFQPLTTRVQMVQSLKNAEDFLHTRYASALGQKLAGMKAQNTGQPQQAPVAAPAPTTPPVAARPDQSDPLGIR